MMDIEQKQIEHMNTDIQKLKREKIKFDSEIETMNLNTKLKKIGIVVAFLATVLAALAKPISDYYIAKVNLCKENPEFKWCQ